MTHDRGDVLQDGRAASARHAWREAFALFSAADERVPLAPDDLDRLAEAAWWIGRIPECVAARERAYAAHVEAEEPAPAALTAVELARAYFQKGDRAVGLAWVNRADRLLASAPESVAHGYVARARSLVSFELERKLDEALHHATRALDLATRFRDRNLMAIALHDQGRIRVARGDVAEGSALMDEATVAGVSGELDPMATATIYCNTIMTCRDLADYPRAREWTEAAKRWCERQAIAGFPGMCRVYRATVTRLRGAWTEAEDEVRRACEELRDFNVGYLGAGLCELGEIRLRMGDLPAAEDAFRQARELGRVPEPGFSMLRRAEGKTQVALVSIRRALADESDRLPRAGLLPALVEIALAACEVEGARAAVEELDAIAQTFGTRALAAGAAAARGALLLALGDASGAARHLRKAGSLWQEIECPYEAARARLALGDAYAAEGDPDAAALELEAARTAFERLGAVLDERRAAERLAAAVASRPGAAGPREVPTFMFTDIVKSTDLLEAIGDEAWSDLARWHDETLRREIGRHGGEEIDHAGDGFFVAFAAAAAAIGCATAIQRALAEHRRTHGFAPLVRIGLHTASAARQGPAYRGRGVHEAARIAAVAEGGEIVASEETLAAVPPGLATSQARRVKLKGLREPLRIVTIHWRQA
jgi:class 3 adenylate cyclase